MTRNLRSLRWLGFVRTRRHLGAGDESKLKETEKGYVKLPVR